MSKSHSLTPSITLSSVIVHHKIAQRRRVNLSNNFMRIFDIGSMRGGRNVEVPALRGVNLNVKSGDRVGIVGRNGAGKSTLLKTIAGIYTPRAGAIHVNGAIQSLFEIGSGFEPEYTGRENILFRGLVMGLTPGEIGDRTDEIIAFAGLGSFIDAPLKAYSTGMMVRLAFAISSYLEGDILLVDEIFGAGDMMFQEKANKRMREVMDRAKILLFTSHNLSLLSELCDKGVWLHRGAVQAHGQIDDVIGEYYRWSASAAAAGDAPTS